MAQIGALPRRLGRYALFDFIGKGGMAQIYLARAEDELGGSRHCVIKEILPSLANDAKFSDMLVFEAKLAAKLSHANIVQVFDLGRTDGSLYIVMDYVDGYDLNALLRECTRRQVALPLEFAVLIVSEVLRGLDYAHRRLGEDGKHLGIVHRDVSPSNVLISFSGEIKLCDFGIARANDQMERRDHAVDEALAGKAGYMSPEHANGLPIDGRADVFATGILLWELIAGRRMYRAQDPSALLEVAKVANVPALPSKGLPNESVLYEIVDKALKSRPEERYSTAAAMLAALEHYGAITSLRTDGAAFGRFLNEKLPRLSRASDEPDVVEDEKARPNLLFESPLAGASLDRAERFASKGTDPSGGDGVRVNEDERAGTAAVVAHQTASPTPDVERRDAAPIVAPPSKKIPVPAIVIAILVAALAAWLIYRR